MMLPPFQSARIVFSCALWSLMVACTPAQEKPLADQPKPTSAGELAAKAQAAFSQGQFDKATTLAKQSAAAAPESIRTQQLAGEILYRSGQAKASLPYFDRVVELDPTTAPQNWQRGIALATCGEFERGAAQFKQHHDVNPDDVENSAWYFLCVAKAESLNAARKTVIPSRGDGRQPMMTILEMLKGQAEPEKVLKAAIDNTREGYTRESAKFYADLYVGLYYDSLDEPENAAKFLRRSLEHDYAGYMVDVARVYLNDRFGKASSAE